MLGVYYVIVNSIYDRQTAPMKSLNYGCLNEFTTMPADMPMHMETVTITTPRGRPIGNQCTLGEGNQPPLH